MLKIWRGFCGITTVKPRSELGLTAQENLKYLSSPPPLTTPANISNLLSTCPPPPHPFRKLTCQLPISQSFLSLQKIRCLITLRSRDLITAHLELFSLRYSPSFYYAVMLVLTLELSNAQLRMLRMSRETIVRKWFIFLNDIHDHQYLEICSAFSLKRMAYQYI